MITSFAQNFEDVLLWRALGGIEHGFYVDVGAQHPVVDSVSKAFYDHGWRGIHVEPTPFYASLLREQRPDETVIQAAVSDAAGVLPFFEIPDTGLSTADREVAERHRASGYEVREISVPGITLADVLSISGARAVHWLKIDVEGYEAKVLEGWPDSGPQPWVVVVESTMPLSQAESHSGWEHRLLGLGYQFVYFDGLNRFYVSAEHDELVPAFTTGPNVFDGFAISGTASSSYAELLNQQIDDLRSQIAALSSEYDARLLAESTRVESQISELAAAREESETAIRALASRERELGLQLQSSQQESKGLSQTLVTREQEFAGRLHDMQKESLQLTQALAIREQEILGQLDAVQQESLHLSRKLVARESEMDAQLAELHAELLRSSHVVTSQERELSVRRQESQEESKRFAETLSDREREFETRLDQCKQTLLSSESRIAALEASRSWAVTRPLRWLGSISKRVCKWPGKDDLARNRGSVIRSWANRIGSTSGLIALGIQRYGLFDLANRSLAAFRDGGIHEIRRRAWIVHQNAGWTVLIQKDQSIPLSLSLPKHEPPIQLSREADAQRLCLSEDYSTDEPTWLRFLGSVLENKLTAPLRAAGTLPPREVLWIAVDCSDGIGVVADRMRTNHSLSELLRATEYTIRSVWRCESDDSIKELIATSEENPTVHPCTGRELLEMIDDRDQVLWIKPGDEIRPEVHMALKYFGCFSAAFSLVDMYFRDNCRIFPLLMHSVDAIHGRSVDYFHGRFIVSGQIAKRALRKLPTAVPYEVARIALSELGPTTNSRSRYVPIPLICIGISRVHLQEMRCRAIYGRLQRAGPEAKYERVAAGGYRPKTSKENQARVGVVICTKNSGLLLRQLLAKLVNDEVIGSIVIVSNNSSDPNAFLTLIDASKNKKIRVLKYDAPFNFSKQCNIGAELLREEAVLFLNDDIVVVSDDWIGLLVSWLDENPNRIVGPLLVYPNQSVQHAGMYLGFNGVAGHALRFAKVPHGEPGFFLTAPRRVSCLTGAALLMSREQYRSLNGFDPRLASYLQDVDLSLRAMNSGAELIFEPNAILIHMESVSIRPDLDSASNRKRRELEYRYFRERWGPAMELDDWMSPLLDPMDESLRTLRI